MKPWQKIAIYIMLIIIGLLLMCGCNSIAKSRTTVEVSKKLSGEVITTTTTEAYSRGPLLPLTAPSAETSTTNAVAVGSASQDAAGIGEVANEGKNQRLLIILGALGVAFGVFVTFHYRTNTKFGVGIIIASGCFAGAGIVYKEIQHYFSIAAGVAIVAAVVYLVWRLSRKEATQQENQSNR